MTSLPSHWIRNVLLLGLTLGLMSCIQMEVVVTLKPDGSGTIVQTTQMPDMQGMAPGVLMGLVMGSGMKVDAVAMQQLGAITGATEESGAIVAHALGDSVTWVSSKQVKMPNGEATQTTYKFLNISKLNGLYGNPLANVGISNSNRDVFALHFEQGNELSRLTIIAPNDSALIKAMIPALTDSSRARIVEQLTLLQGFRSKITLRIDGNIQSTNATLRTKNLLTILDFDCSKLAASAQDTTWRKSIHSMPKSIAQARLAIGQVPGFQMDRNDSLVVEFSK